MTTLSELESAANRCQGTPFDPPDYQFLTEKRALAELANPATILAMIEFIRLQHEELKSWVDTYNSPSRAIEEFKKWEGE